MGFERQTRRLMISDNLTPVLGCAIEAPKQLGFRVHTVLGSSSKSAAFPLPVLLLSENLNSQYTEECNEISLVL